MKIISYILLVVVMLAVVVADATAQRSSSATQTVTFAVQRSASVAMARLNSTVPAAPEGSIAPLKMTIGSDDHAVAHDDVVAKGAITGNSFASNTQFSSLSGSTMHVTYSPSTNVDPDLAARKHLVVTLTE